MVYKGGESSKTLGGLLHEIHVAERALDDAIKIIASVVPKDHKLYGLTQEEIKNKLEKPHKLV